MSRWQSIASTFALLAALACAQAARGQCQYELVVVNLPSAPTTTIYLQDIANDGTAGGLLATFFHQPIVVAPDGVITQLPALIGGGEVEAVSSTGIAVGWVRPSTDTYVPALWVDGALSLLPLPFPALGYALAVNDRGTIAGFVDGYPGDPSGPCAWIDGEIMPLYETVFDGALATGVADDDTIGGYSSDPNGGGLVPFVWKDGQVSYLPRIPDTDTATVDDMSSNGVLVGECFTWPSGIWHAVVWSGGVPIDCGVLPAYWRTRGRSVNALGQAVGDCQPPAGSLLPSTGFLWQDGQLYDLFALLTSPFVGRIQRAWGINDRGEICGSGIAADGHGCGIILRPIRTRAGDVTIDCTVDARDVSKLLEFWGRAYAYDDGPGDLNGDRMVDAQDLAIVLGDWGP